MKKRIKGWLCLALVVASCVIIDAPVAYAQGLTNTVATSSPISTYANRTGWLYKIENGVLWRRLYDYSRREWIGDWERA